MAKGTDVAMDELIFAYEGGLSRRRSVQRGRHLDPLSSGLMPGHRGFYEGWPCKWYVPELDSDQSATATNLVISPLVGQVPMNGFTSGKMRRRSGTVVVQDQDLST